MSCQVGEKIAETVSDICTPEVPGGLEDLQLDPVRPDGAGGPHSPGHAGVLQVLSQRMTGHLCSYWA